MEYHTMFPNTIDHAIFAIHSAFRFESLHLSPSAGLST